MDVVFKDMVTDMAIREHEIADVTKKQEFTPFYQKFSLFVFVSEKNIAFLFSLLFVE
jgi:hypothetical protein